MSSDTKYSNVYLITHIKKKIFFFLMEMNVLIFFFHYIPNVVLHDESEIFFDLRSGATCAQNKMMGYRGRLRHTFSGVIHGIHHYAHRHTVMVNFCKELYGLIKFSTSKKNIKENCKKLKRLTYSI